MPHCAVVTYGKIKMEDCTTVVVKCYCTVVVPVYVSLSCGTVKKTHSSQHLLHVRASTVVVPAAALKHYYTVRY